MLLEEQASLLMVEIWAMKTGGCLLQSKKTLHPNKGVWVPQSRFAFQHCRLALRSFFCTWTGRMHGNPWRMDCCRSSVSLSDRSVDKENTTLVTFLRDCYLGILGGSGVTAYLIGQGPTLGI